MPTLTRRAFCAGTSAALAVPVSPAPGASITRLAARIAEFDRLTVALNAIDHYDQPMQWNDVADRRCRALEALLDHRPADIAEFGDKFQALITFTAEDTDFTVLRLLAEDIRALAKAARAS